MKHQRGLLYSISIIGLVFAAAVAASANIIHRPASASGQKPAPADDLNERMVRFCRERLGRKVGSGQCADLTAQALTVIGAKAQFKDYPANGDYVWGRLVGKLEVKHGKKIVESSGVGKTTERRGRIAAKAGDIIQFRDAVFEGRSGRGSYRRICPHHTAVIDKVSEDGSYCKVLEQNASGKFYVVENVLRLSDLTGGWLRVYRPIGKKSTQTANR